MHSVDMTEARQRMTLISSRSAPVRLGWPQVDTRPSSPFKNPIGRL